MDASMLGRLRDFWSDGVLLIRHPGTSTFLTVAAKADLPLAVAGSAAGGFVSGLLFNVFAVELAVLILALARNVKGLRIESADPTLLAALVGVAIGWLITMPFLAMLNSVFNLFILGGCLFASGYLLGVRGSFAGLTYSLGALITVASVVSAGLLVIPVVGWVAVTVFSIYLLAPLTNCLRAIFGIGAGKATLIWLAPLAAYLLLLLLLALPLLVASVVSPPEPGFL